MQKFLPYAKQSISQDDQRRVAAALEQDLITRGPQVEAFEEALRRATGAEFVVVMNSGSTALDAAYFAAEANASDRILSTPNTFVATVGPGIRRGMSPLFIDIDTSHGSLNLDQALLNLDYESSRGKLFFVPVHFAGIALDMKTISRQIKKTNVVIIEDAAHALGSFYPSGEKVGSCAWSDMTILSFHPAKTITSGEGGAVTTNDPALYERLKLFRNNGIVRGQEIWNYEVDDLTGNYHMTESAAALGLSQLSRLDQFVEKRRKLVKKYRQCLKGFDKIKLFTDQQDDYTAFHLFVIQTKMNRTNLMDQLKKEGVGSQLHYIPLYRHPFFMKTAGDISEYFPEMEKYFDTALSLPLYYDLEEKEVEYICTTLKRLLQKN